MTKRREPTRRPEVPNFDLEKSPLHLDNVKIAKQLGWEYDRRYGVYRDYSGRAVADELGRYLKGNERLVPRLVD